MSQASDALNTASSYDWKLIAAAAATFLATLVTIVCGWFQARKKMAAKLESGDLTVTSAVLLDNQTIREATMVNREVRDRLLVQCEAVQANTKALTAIDANLEDVVEELKKIRKSLDHR